MEQKKTRNISYLISFAAHFILFLLFMWIHFSDNYEEEYVTVGFGTGGSISEPGAIGNTSVQESNTPEVEQHKEKTEAEQKKVELPETKNTDEENTITKTNKKEDKVDTPPEKVKPIKKEEANNKGKESEGMGEGNFGFEIDFGGKGVRKIYSYVLPSYPEGVSKEIDVKLRFTILPDGTVGNIFPLIKADAKLESAAINSLRQWRFEPLREGMKQIDQTVVITFPYRLQ